jgi:hypothetical protein
MGGDIFLRLPWSSIYFVRDVDLERLDHFVELNRNAGASIQNIIADFELNFVKKLEVPYPYFRSRDGQTFDQVDGDHDGISWRFSYLKPLRDERERGVRRTAKFRSLSHESVPVNLHLSDDSENFLMVERYRYLPIRLGRNNPNFVLYYGYRHKMRLIRNARISKNEKYYESLNPPRNLLLTERGDWIQYDIDSNWGVRAIWNGKAFEKYLSENPEFEQKVFESLARTSPSKVELLEEARSRKTHTWKSIVFDQYCKTASDAVRNDFREVPLNSGL